MSEYVFRTDEPIKRCYGFSNGVGECPLIYSCNVYKQTDVETKEKNAVWINRLPNCPLKELSEHGDIGDVSSLYAELLAEIQTSKIVNLQDVIKIINRVFEDAPTILEASNE